MNFLQLQQRLARRRGANDSSIVTATGTRYKDALNEVHRGLLRMPGMESLRYGTLTFASVASQKLYALPVQGVARINRITEATNDRKMEYRTPDWLDTVAPDPTTGTPWAWIPRGYAEVHTQPSDASEIFVDSTAAGDTNTAYIEGFITGGYYRTASVSMTGVTAVSLSTTITNFIHITKFYLSAAAVGTVTLHEDASGGTELARIAIGDVRAQFLTFQLYNTPSAVVTYTADVLRSIPDMSNDTDEPLIPDDFHDLLLDKAERKELRKQDDPQRMRMLDADILRGERELRTFVTNHPDWRPNFGGGPAAEFSSLGAWYPADVRVG
jgi:hypothetical protein